ncbi:MAG: glycosyltransferase, partial [Bacteroidota bacterium]|nr:glycosyltransferase [Bacteroidota bacterium]
MKTIALSILIPIYNVALDDLIKRLIPQTEKLQIAFEICIADDASTDAEIQKANALLAEQNQCIYTVFHENRGRTATRHFLAENALYDNLLFLDADVLP